MLSPSTIGRYPISICMAIAMHLVWTAGLLVEPSALLATGPHALVLITSNAKLAASVLFVVASMALIGVAAFTPRLRILLLLPQQVILWFSLIGATNAMWLGMFADGTERSHWFLVVDQVGVVLVALGHTAALLLIARGEFEHVPRQ